MPGERIKKGDRYRVVTAFVTSVLTMWKAPFTDGAEKTIPANLIFLIDHDPLPGSEGVAALPDPYDEWEKRLVSQTDRDSEKYNGYYLVATFDQLSEHCVRC